MAQTGRVILVDDDEAVRAAGGQALDLAGFQVDSYASADGVLETLSRAWTGVLITDVKMPRTDGLTLMRRALEIDADIPVVLITGHGDVAMAVFTSTATSCAACWSTSPAGRWRSASWSSRTARCAPRWTTAAISRRS